MKSTILDGWSRLAGWLHNLKKKHFSHQVGVGAELSNIIAYISDTYVTAYGLYQD